MNIEVYPPHISLSSTPLTEQRASELLSTFLTLSESTPHLHPDALITPSGVSFSTNGGPTGGAIIHNLRRIEAGMRGEYVEPSPSPEPEERTMEEDGGAGRVKKDKRSGKAKLNDMNGEETVGEQSEGWQDMEEFQAQQAPVEVGEVADRVNVQGEQLDHEPEVVATGEKERKRKREKEGGLSEKEAKKKAKKERLKEMKKEKEKNRVKKE